MKIKFILSLFALFLFTSFNTVDAATFTWLGSNGAWDDASQWDTGSVPSYGDDVIIPSGYCRIYGGDDEGAMSVEVQNSARLYIYEGGHLEINGAVDNDGLHNMGRVYIYGSLAINEITQSNYWNSANAIRNEKYIFTYSNSVINIKYIDDIAIENYAANSYFRNRGFISLYSIGNLAIRNEDRFYNYGTIDIQNSGGSSNGLLTNSDIFRNYPSGIINLKSDIYSAISSGSSTGSFRNDGEINIEEVSIGVINTGNFINTTDADIIIKDCSSVAFDNRIGGTITNDGYVYISQTTVGLNNREDFINNGVFHIFNTGNNGGIRNYSTGKVENYRRLTLSAAGYKDIYNEGKIYNFNGGSIFMNKVLDMSSGSSFSNYGFLISRSSNSHIINGSFGNKGVIEDIHGKLLPYISNDRVVIAPVSGPMQVGVPFPNILDVASLTDVNIVDWKISPNGAIAGTYNETTNEFTPNASAIGVSTLYISIYDLVSGNGRNFSLAIDSPIVPFTKRGGISSARNELNRENSSFEAADVKVYPNPSNGTIHLKSDVFQSHQTQILIFNSLGQLAQQEQLNEGNNNQSLDFSSDLKNGIYFIKIMREGNEIDVKRVHLNR